MSASENPTPTAHPMHWHFASRRIRTVFDVAITVVALGVIIGLAASNYGIYIMRAYTGEALMNAATLKQELAGHYYRTGEWLAADPGLFDYSDDKRATRNVEYEKGGFTFTIQHGKERYLLTFRAALSDSSPRSPILWLCGYDAVPKGYHTISKNRTNIPVKYLPAECRGSS